MRRVSAIIGKEVSEVEGASSTEDRGRAEIQPRLIAGGR
jgi:hypothetical protein